MTKQEMEKKIQMLETVIENKEATIRETQATVEKARVEYKKLGHEKNVLEAKLSSAVLMEISGMRIYKEDKPTKKGGLHVGYATVAYTKAGTSSYSVSIFKNRDKLSILPPSGKDPKYPPVKIDSEAQNRIIRLIEENLANNTRITLI